VSVTDLERLWDELPSGTPPTERILAAGRRRSRSSRLVKRPLVAVGAVAALSGAFVTGSLMSSPPGGPGSPTPPAPQADVSPVAFQADLSPAASCDALLTTYVDRALGQVTAWGWESPYGYAGYGEGDRVLRELYGTFDASNERGASAPLSQTSAKDLGTTRVTASDTGTNVQEGGVDEPDTVKTDGRLLVRLREDELLTFDVTGPRVRQLSSLRLDGVGGGQILLAGSTVVVVGADNESQRSEQTGQQVGTRVQTVSLRDPGAPEVTDDVAYDAAVTSVRQQGSTVRMVLSAGLPDLPFVHPGRARSSKEALVHNRQIVERSRLRDWLPGYTSGDRRSPLLECENVAVPPAKVGLDTVAVVTFGTDAPTAPQAFGLAGATTIAYASADRLYLASTPTPEWWCFGCRSSHGTGGGTSYLFEFDLADDHAVHVASGEVEGTIRDRWSLDEVRGQLRVLVGPSSETGNYNSIVTLERRGARLVESGRLDDLGRNEDIKSVRWQDDLALVVTYRQVDPLYVIDLKGEPRIISELKVPGFSSYLHPLGSRRLIGVGSGPSDSGWGAQLGLFRVRNLERPALLDEWDYSRGTAPVAGNDPRAFTWLPEHRSVLTVIRRGRTGWLSVQHLAEGTLDNRMVQVEHGTDINEVRTLGMPDGRVVLVTGEDVRFLRLTHPPRGR
jgi:hypothetical protein